jgi:hypothetical protein
MVAECSPSFCAADPVEPLLRDPPAGIFVESTWMAPATQLNAIAQKLGGEIEHLSNSAVRVQGRSIQINVIAAVDEENAKAIEATFTTFKKFPFCVRKGNLVVEYVGRNIDEALALKTTYELGLRDKPQQIRYRVVAQMAPVDRADYMACTPLLNQFLALEQGASGAAKQIDSLVAGFTFSHTLSLRSPELDSEAAQYAFEPKPLEVHSSGATVQYTFGDLERNRGVPFVTATMDIRVASKHAHEASTHPSRRLTAATPFWPVEDARIVALAQQITSGQTTPDGKVRALLQWLTPGTNLKYSGEIGSRWGTLKVLEQGFGRCWDFSDCFVTLARAAGVPSRQVGGWLYGTGGHIWAEVFSDAAGWQQVDPTGGVQLGCGIYHIPLFTTEDGAMPIVYVSSPEIELVETR